MAEEETTSLNEVQKTAGILSDLIKTAGNTPEAKEAAKNLGKSAVILSKTIKNCLLPLAAVNYAFDKARIYFTERFDKEIYEKTNSIPAENLIEPKGSIAGPTLQGLAFSHEEPNIKEMYLNLLKTSMDNRTSNDAHPAFVEIIKQLTSEEALLLRDVLLSYAPIPLAQVRATRNTGGFNIKIKHLASLSNSATQQPVINKRFPAMVDNWVRLGLVEVTYQSFLTDETRYDWIKNRPEYMQLEAETNNEVETISFNKGLMEPTDLGKLFKSAAL